MPQHGTARDTLSAAFEGRDGAKWEQKEMKQFGADQQLVLYQNSAVTADKQIALKVVFKSKFQTQTLLNLISNSPLRAQWEKTLIKFEYRSYSKDWSQQRVCFRYTNPMTTASRGSGDKQIILDQSLWFDFPRKGHTTVHYDNVESDNNWPLTDNLQ